MGRGGYCSSLHLDKDEDEHDIHHGGVELEAHVTRADMEDTAEDTLVCNGDISW